MSSHCEWSFSNEYQASVRTETYLEGAFDFAEHSMTVYSPGEQIPAPQEMIDQSLSAQEPCGSSEISYSNLGQWWRDYAECNELGTGADASLMLTDYDSEYGICYNDQFAVAEGGQHVAQLPSTYELYGCDRPFDSMQTALHEVAHALLTYSESYEHNVGDTIDHSGTKARTPMATAGQNNECGNYVDYPSTAECDSDGFADKYNEMRYSECNESKMEHT